MVSASDGSVSNKLIDQVAQRIDFVVAWIVLTEMMRTFGTIGIGCSTLKNL